MIAGSSNAMKVSGHPRSISEVARSSSTTALVFLALSGGLVCCPAAFSQEQNGNQPPLLRPPLASPLRAPSGPSLGVGGQTAPKRLNSINSSSPLATPLQNTRIKAPEETADIVEPPDIGAQLFEQDSMLIGKPALQALITIDRELDPFTLDSKTADQLDLKRALQIAINNNLDIAISKSEEQTEKWNYYSSLGNFLPNVGTSYREFWTHGQIGLPKSASNLFNSFGNANGLAAGRRMDNVDIDGPFVISNAFFQYYGYRGGRILFGALQAKHTYRAAKAGRQVSFNDALLAAATNYYNLVLSQALLQIRVKAVQTSEEQLRVNTDKREFGLATELDVLQSKTQLSRDRQDLIDQQIARRTAAIKLADTLNVDMGADLSPSESWIKRVRLIDPKVKVENLISLAISNRPELKQFEEQRLAAKRNIVVASAPLQPTFAFNGNVFGIGPGLTKQEALFTLGIDARWALSGLGTVDATKIKAAKLQARTAQLQANKELVTILDQVRSSYLQCLDTDKKIDETTNEVESSHEQLRLAQLRFANGLGTNLDIITAQRDYTQALINKAEAIIDFNNAQVQLVHDVGLTSVDTLTTAQSVRNSP